MTTETGGHDVLATVGVFLTVGAVISMAVWLGMVTGGLPDGSAPITGLVTLALLAAGLTCCAVDRPRTGGSAAEGHPVAGTAVVP